MKFKASTATKNGIVESPSWVGDGIFMIKKENLSPVNIAQLQARGIRNDEMEDVTIDGLLSENLKEFIQLDIILPGIDNGKEIDVLIFYCSLTDQVICINRVYSSIVQPIMFSNGGPLTNETRSVIIAPMRSSMLTDKAEDIKIAGQLAEKLASK